MVGTERKSLHAITAAMGRMETLGCEQLRRPVHGRDVQAHQKYGRTLDFRRDTEVLPPQLRAAINNMASLSAFEQRAHQMACSWLQARMDDAQEAQIQALVDETPEDDRDRMRALSEGWRAWRLSYLMQISDDGSLPKRLEEAVAHAQASAWPRAQVLATAAVALWTERTLPGGTSHWLRHADGLKASIDAMPANWPAVERCVCEVRLGELELQLARSEELLERILRLERLEFPPPLDDPMRANVRQLLVVLLLEMGDMEGALTSSQGLLRYVEQGPARSVSMYYNHLLALGLAGRHDEARAFLAERPFLRDPGYWHEVPQALGVVAWLDSQDQPAGTTTTWPTSQGSLPAANGNPISANLAWMQAQMALQQSDPRQAVDVLLGYLQQVRAPSGASLSPLNGTLIYQSLSRAHEALGNTAAALDALRSAQAYGHEWTLRSTEARLKALHLAAPATGAGVQSRRVQALHGEQNPQPPNAATRLLAHVSHEMRNPLHGVLGMISLLQMSKLDPDQRRQLELADASARMALALCNDLLDLAKLDSSRLEIHVSPGDVRALLAQVVQTWSPQAQFKGLVLLCEADPSLPARLLFDRLRVQQVLVNLLANAVKFTRRGQVLLTAQWLIGADGGRLRVEVRDTGIGITSQERDRLFQEFSQASSSVAAEFGGSGLGLALCRKLVVAMGGQIDVTSEAGRGSCFWFELPCSPAAEPTQE